MNEWKGQPEKLSGFNFELTTTSIKKERYFSLVHYRRDVLFSYDFQDFIRVHESWRDHSEHVLFFHFVYLSISPERISNGALCLPVAVLQQLCWTGYILPKESRKIIFKKNRKQRQAQNKDKIKQANRLHSKPSKQVNKNKLDRSRSFGYFGVCCLLYSSVGDFSTRYGYKLYSFHSIFGIVTILWVFSIWY